MATSSSNASSSSSPNKVNVPQTPSPAINKLLESKCTGSAVDSKPKLILAQVVCGVFRMITLVYNQIHKDKSANPKMWMASCGAVALGICLASLIGYSVVIGSAFLLHSVLYYVCIGIAVAGLGLCGAGAFFFGKDSSLKQGFEEEEVKED